MKGIERIVAYIEQTANEKSAEVSREIENERTSVINEGKKQAQELYERKIQEGLKEVEERKDRLLKAADMESRKTLLACKQEIVDEVFSKTEEMLLSMPSENYLEFLLSQTVRASVTGRETLVLNKKDQKEYGEKLVKRANRYLNEHGKAGQLVLAEETGAFSGGLMIRENRISVDCTLEALIAHARETMTSFAAKELFA